MEQIQFSFTSTSQPPRPLTVTELTARVKGLLETEIGTVWVKGEISNFKPSTAGHLYFSLKDEAATLSCALFRGSKPKFAVKDGLEVLVKGRVSVYAPRGSYQLIVESLEPLGHGALQLAFEQLKAKLQAEGLFEASRKRLLPAYPQKIVLITSPTGAALQDMLNVLDRRNAGISILIVPSLVQGDEAPSQICQALKIANEYHLGDVIIVARGGGSIEDLWCFNDERVVRAVAQSAIPVISAVGHEVDFTLCDFVADLRAPTPSAAAEVVSKNRLELIDQLHGSEKRLQLSMTNRVSKFRQNLLTLETKLVSPAERMARVRKRVEELELRLQHALTNMLPTSYQQVDEFYLKLTHALERKFTDRRRRLETLTGTLEALSPLKVLGRGYTLIQDPENRDLVKSKVQAISGRKVDLIFYDGKAQAKIL